jgi:hypothetical protein
MPPEIKGPGAAGGVPLPPSAPVRPAAPSRALVPVERVGPRAPTDSPLGRSGVAIDDLLFATDLLETREAVAPVAMELGLETARRQLLQRMAAESLESLDAVWARAAGSEEGWYLRAGALTMLGHPHEGDKVAADGLESQPQSLALRFMQSVARALVGDLSGARAALSPALNHAPDDPVLLAQQAVVLAKQGHEDDAADLLQRLASAAPEHPALLWARTAVRMARADRTRGSARSAWSPDHAAMPGHTDNLAHDPEVEAIGAEGVMADEDLVAAAFRRLGTQLRTHTDDALVHEARTVLRACAAGGTLASSCMPAEAHAARQLLTALLAALRGDRAGDALVGREPSPLTPLVQQLLPLLRSERQGAPGGVMVDADRVLRRLGGTVPPEVRQLIGLLIQGREESLASTLASSAGAKGAPEIGLLVEDGDLGPLVPVRLGLSLLGETAVTRALEWRQDRVDAGAAVVTGRAPATVGAVFVPSDQSLLAAPRGGESGGSGWGATGAAVGRQSETGAAAGVGAALPVILLVAGALGAAVNGAGVVAAVLGGAGLWLSLRSRGQSP